MQHFSTNPIEMVASLWRNRELIQALTRREVLGRYRGSIFGLLWSFFNPVFMLIIYTFVFSVVFKSRWPGGGESKTEFALVLFIGLIVINIFAECINRAPSLILSNVNYVKKVVFPLEILPFIGLISALFHGGISLGVWLLVYLVIFGMPPVTAFYLPLIVLPFILFIMGLSWALASLGVYLRDIAQIIGMVTTVLMFISPIFYPVTALPEEYRDILYFNPLTVVIEQSRAVMYFGVEPDFGLLALYLPATIIVCWAGYFCFQRTRKGFADVL